MGTGHVPRLWPGFRGPIGVNITIDGRIRQPTKRAKPIFSQQIRDYDKHFSLAPVSAPSDRRGIEGIQPFGGSIEP